MWTGHPFVARGIFESQCLKYRSVVIKAVVKLQSREHCDFVSSSSSSFFFFLGGRGTHKSRKGTP